MFNLMNNKFNKLKMNFIKNNNKLGKYNNEKHNKSD
jgi:hypothetical protein